MGEEDVPVQAVTYDSMEQLNMEDDYLQPSEETELRKDLDERHINMIAFSAVVGIGLFLQAGKVTYLAGPGWTILSYLFMGSIMWSVMACLGEMTALLPVKGPIFEFPGRFLDRATGYAVGWMAWFTYVIIVAVEIAAVAQLFKFQFTQGYLEQYQPHDPNTKLTNVQWPFFEKPNSMLWVFPFMIITLVVNLLPVRWFGEVEYVCGCFKMVFISGLILFNIVLNRRLVARFHTSPFQYYNEPYGFISANFTQRAFNATGQHESEIIFQGSGGHLASVWSAMTTAVFSLIGFDAVAITAAENKDLARDESMKLATRKISLRIILLYTLAAFTVGLNVPYNDPNLADYNIHSLKSGQYSIFIIQQIRDGLIHWPHFFNAFFIFSATSAGINALYISSRLLHALASLDDVWPRSNRFTFVKRRLRRTYNGVPVTAVFVSWCFGWLSSLVSSKSSSEVSQDLGRLATNAVVSNLIVYAVACVTYLLFWRCLNFEKDPTLRHPPNHSVQAYDRENRRYPYKSHFQWLRAVYGLSGCILIIFFNGWRSFIRPTSPRDFVSSYISVFIFIALVILYHVKEEGVNPMNWRRNTSNDLTNAVSVLQPHRRKGKFYRVDKKRVFSKSNVKAFFEVIWIWMK